MSLSPETRSRGDEAESVVGSEGSPSPRPSPPGRGSAADASNRSMPTSASITLTNAENDNLSSSDSRRAPSPGGEGRGEGGPEIPNTDRLAQLLTHGLRPDGGAFTVGRPDQSTFPLVTASGAKVVAKFSTADRAASTFANMNALWVSSFGARRQPPGLPQPLDFLPDCGALIMERLDGRPLAELHASATEHFEPALRLLADLHQCDAMPAVKRSSRSLVRSAERKAARIADLSPEHASLANELAAALDANRVKERELVPSHGDFSPRNVFAGANRLALIDWDRLQLADPARDVVYFATYDWADWLRRGRMPNRDHVKRAIEIYEAARPGAKLKRAVSFHIAASCLRRALSILELWPDQRWLAPAWLQIGLRELSAAQ